MCYTIVVVFSAGSSVSLIQSTISTLQSKFALRTLGSISYFLGFEATRSAAGLHLCQSKYVVELLHKTNMANCKPCSSPLCLNTRLSKLGGKPFADPFLYRSTIGALQYLCNTQPDIAFTINKLSQFPAAPFEEHWTACTRVLRYLKGTSSLGLFFKPASNLHLAVYSDAEWASCLDDRRSTSGYCVYLGDNLITWSSKKQSVTAQSSAEAEYRALANAASDILWLKSLFAELGVQLSGIPVLWCDSTSAAPLAQNPVFHARTKHIEIDVHFVREKIAVKVFSVQAFQSSKG
ncbi:hypothetical protein ACOSP7_003981 [Xanthoceras sorbifolium]